MNNEGGEVIMDFKGFADSGVKHFQKISTELVGSNIIKIIKLTTYFPGLISYDANIFLNQETNKEELLHVLSIFHKHKTPSLDG
jgi:hypothetical protein